MAKGRKLTVKQERFCREYIANGGNASEAYRAAYDTKGNQSTVTPKAYRMLQQSHIRAMVDRLRSEEEARVKRKYQLDNDRVLKEYARLASVDVRKLFNEDGTAKLPHELDDDTAAAVGGIEVDYKPDGTAKFKFKLLDKRQPLQDVAKMLGMFREDNAQRRAIFDMTNEELEAIAKG